MAMAAPRVRSLLVALAAHLAVLAVSVNAAQQLAENSLERDAVALLQLDSSVRGGKGEAEPAPDGMAELPEELAQIMDAEDPESLGKADQEGTSSEQHVANFISAMFSDKPEGEAIDGSDDGEVLNKLTGYIKAEEGKPSDNRTSWTFEDPPELFFTENRLQALERIMDANRADVAAKAKLFREESTADLHAGYSQVYDLLPEEGKEEEKGQKWHIQLSRSQEGGNGNAISIVGHGLVRHIHAAQ